MANLRGLFEIADAQHGVISIDQAERLGIARSSVHDVVHREGWTKLHRGIYLIRGTPRGFRQEAQAALLALGPTAVLCRRTAAHLFGLVAEPEVVEVFIPQEERTRGLRGVRVYRTRTLRLDDLATVDGLRTTAPGRTMIDLAAVLEPPTLRAVLIEARQRRLVDLDRLDRRVAEMGPVRGIGVIRRLIWELHPEQADSILEARARGVIRSAGLPPPAPAPVRVRAGGRTLHVDIGWPAKRVGVEVDGFGYHSSRADLERDHRRANALALAGWTILHVGWERLESDTAGFVTELRAALG